MTVAVAQHSFKRLLFRWKGSVWKSLWKELLVYLIMYCSINSIYRMAMTPEQMRTFEAVVHFVNTWTTAIPLQFLLGFFVSYIIARWWEQLNCVPWPDKFLYLLAFNYNAMDEKSRIERRTIARWCNLHMALTWREISIKIKKRFPTIRHLIETGLMTHDEYDMYDKTVGPHGKWFLPVAWIGNLLKKLRDEGKITDYAFQKLSQECYQLRAGNGALAFFDWINTPLRYIQITTFATYAYFFVVLLGRQGVRTSHQVSSEETTEIDVYVPIITVLEFVFYVGWLKVAEENRMPFGEADDDMDMNYILDRDLQVSYMIVDQMAGQHPPAVRDDFFDDNNPMVRHTKASYSVRDRIPNWRLHRYVVPESSTKLLPQFNYYDDPPPAGSLPKKKWVLHPSRSRSTEPSKAELGAVGPRASWEQLGFTS